MKLEVGNKIKLKNGKWSFSGSTPNNFDAHIKKSVPLYVWSHNLSLNFSEFFN